MCLLRQRLERNHPEQRVTDFYVRFMQEDIGKCQLTYQRLAKQAILPKLRAIEFFRSREVEILIQELEPVLLLKPLWK